MHHTATRTHVTDVRTIAVPVTDQDAALAFYTEKLGFEKRMDIPMGPSMRWLEVAPSATSAAIAIVPPGEAFYPGVDTGIRLTTTDAAADHAAMEANGVDVDELMTVPMPMFGFHDQDGNKLYVVQTPPRQKA
jgi:catechol 2,3-dioxygenase-like lactoylglutathione lyase family enzyme